MATGEYISVANQNELVAAEAVRYLSRRLDHLGWINGRLSGESNEGGSMIRLSGPWKASRGSWRTSGGGCARW